MKNAIRALMVVILGESPAAVFLGYRGIPSLPGYHRVIDLDKWLEWGAVKV